MSGQLSPRAHKVMGLAHLVTVRDLAVYHRDDPRYRTLGGCGLKTRREFNAIIKAVYGTLALKKIPEPVPTAVREDSWMARWNAETEGVDDELLAEEHTSTIAEDSIAAEWEREGTLTLPDRRYYDRCRAYFQLIEERRGIPLTLDDLQLHRWFLQQHQSELHKHRAALFAELCRKLGMF